MTTASLSDDEIEDRFFLLGQMEILSVLNDLVHHREPVTVYFNGGRDFMLTTILEARSDCLIFDPSGDAKANKRLPNSSNCVFVARLNGIRVQFSTKNAHPFSWGGSDAFWAPLPARVVRLQRRESYRILLPVAKPLMVKCFADDGLIIGEWPSHNLGVMGLGIAMSRVPNVEPNQSIARIKLMLTKQNVVECAAIVRHVTPLGERQTRSNYRVGLSFAKLPPAMGVMIQRYITKVEHERRNLANKASDRKR
ncbi:MAG: flagellar brake protein [Burkholderiaceae bacterium]